MAIPDWVDPQLATLTQDRFSDPSWIYERKLDGERCLSFVGVNGDVRLLTRNQNDITTTFPEISGRLAGQDEEGFVVDGEIVAFLDSETSFSRLQQRLGVVQPSPALLADYPVIYYIFDVMYARGADTRRLPELERKELLAGLLEYGGPLRYTEHRAGDGVEFWRQACADGWEGLIAKDARAAYHAGRSKNWLKFKCVTGQEFVIGGFTDPKGSRQGFGALLVGYYDPHGDLIYAGKVGTGFSDAVLRGLHAALAADERPTPAFVRGDPPRAGTHWVEPRLVGQVSFEEWTNDGKLRQPRFQGLRDDKDPSEVVREVPSEVPGDPAHPSDR
jgi:bifunctional non-homologous end joining protein LigD